MTRREEIARLVKRLRNDGVVRSPGIFNDAASALTQQEAEIARLKPAAPAVSGEPVAWRVKRGLGSWGYVETKADADYLYPPAADVITEPLYAAPSAGEDAVWPEWAERILAKLQEYGADPVDGGEVDLADAFEQWVDGYAEQFAASAPADISTEAGRINIVSALRLKVKQLEAQIALAPAVSGEPVAFCVYETSRGDLLVYTPEQNITAYRDNVVKVTPVYAAPSAVEDAKAERLLEQMNVWLTPITDSLDDDQEREQYAAFCLDLQNFIRARKP